MRDTINHTRNLTTNHHKPSRTATRFQSTGSCGFCGSWFKIILLIGVLYTSCSLGGDIDTWRDMVKKPTTDNSEKGNDNSGLTFTLIENDTAYSVTSTYGIAGDVVIPAVYNGLPVTAIGNSDWGEVFYNITNMTSITIPASVTNIDDWAFSGCIGLERITVKTGNVVYESLGNCLIRIADNTIILGCKTSVIPIGVLSIGDYAFAYYVNLTSITIPSSVTSIGSSAFYNCYGLTSITIPDSVTRIGSNAFYHCGLTSIIVQGMNPPQLGSGAFPKPCPIYVPDSAVAAYQSSWSDYSDQIVSINTM